MRRLATIDVGSNTVLLLVAEVTDDHAITVVEDGAEITRLGERGFDDHALREQPMARTIAALSDMRARLESLGATLCDAVATSVVREASNSQAFLLMAQAVGVPLRVISGEEEAELSFLSVAREPPPVDAEELLVLDIGGGSSELALGTREGVASRVSLPLGVVRLTESTIQRHPVSREVLGELRAAARLQLQSKHVPKPLGSCALVGVAGTVTSLAAIHHELPASELSRTHGLSLTSQEVEALLDRLARMSLEQRRALTGLDPKRADVIVAGAAVLLEIMSHASAERVWVSDRGVRWGLLHRAIA